MLNLCSPGAANESELLQRRLVFQYLCHVKKVKWAQQYHIVLDREEPVDIGELRLPCRLP